MRGLQMWLRATHNTTWRPVGWRPITEPFERVVVTVCTTCLTFKISAFCQHPLCLGVSVLLTGNGDYFTMLHLVTGLYKEDRVFSVR
jgi:hypothetical protein